MPCFLPFLSVLAGNCFMRMYVLRCFFHVPCLNCCCCQNIGIFQKEQYAWRPSRLSLIVVLAGSVFNPAAWLLSPLQIPGSGAVVQVPVISECHFPAWSIPAVPNLQEPGYWLTMPIMQSLCFVVFVRSLCENSACSWIKINKNQEDLLHAGDDRSLLQWVLQLQGSTGRTGECQPSVHR